MTRVALLDAPLARVLHAGLLRDAPRAGGHDATLVRVPRPPEAPLRRRGFTGPLAHVPLAVLALRRGGFDLAHAFTPPDAWAARLARLPVVFTCAEELARENVADRRLRLQLLRAAVEDSAAVAAADEAVRASLLRWLAVDAPVVAATDAAAYARIYREAVG